MTTINDNLYGIENGNCRITCVSTTTSVDGAGDYTVNRRLACRWNTSNVAGDRIHVLEISGATGAAPVATLNGGLLPGNSVTVDADGMAEIRDLNGMLIDRVRLPINDAMTLECGANEEGTTSLTRPVLGLTVRPVSSELAHHVAIDPLGTCVVDDVVAGSPAFVAGIDTNDVLLEVNGRKASPTALKDEIASATDGRPVRLTWLCKGLKRKAEVRLDADFEMKKNATPGMKARTNGSSSATRHEAASSIL